ncbi:MAG: sigma-54 dependent transcriptional regulator, partial [Vicinamibacteraceae bacterium]|nr:sigma-54 dependent transcriptional regulator [Vicinamibacteraceae bacterium]
MASIDRGMPHVPHAPHADEARRVPESGERGAPAPRDRHRVVVADDERSMRELLAIVLAREGYEVAVAENGQQALAAIAAGGADLLISDIRMPDMSGVDVLRAAKQSDPDFDGIFITAFASAETAVDALRLGACDYLTKPFDVDELKLRVRKALERRTLRRENVALKRRVGEPLRFAGMIGRGDAMLNVFRLIETIAATTSTVLITGESGTGKELAARAIHYHSLRRHRPFVALNCGALTETLLESELFGHVKGAFTGAAGPKKGLVEVAHEGTIFLDEIGEMSPGMQVKLLRVLQERKFRRVGGTDEIDADIRILAATHRDLQKEVAEGRFREDLYYRINVIPLHLPPLRERREDIALLARHFLEKFSSGMGKAISGFSGEARAALEGYAWPGNIRELENAVERAVALEASSVILPESLPEAVRAAGAGRLVVFPSGTPLPVDPSDAVSRDGAGAASPDATQTPARDDETLGASEGPRPGQPLPAGFDLERHVQAIEREYLAEALRQSGGVKMKAAELLGMSFRSFRYYARKYDL